MSKFVFMSLTLVLGVFTALPTSSKDHALVRSSTANALPAPNESAAMWFRQGALRAHDLGAGKHTAKNIILFIGDGMSLTTVAAARILEGQQRGQSGEENNLSFEQFPYTALSKTYNIDSQTPDSAGTMSAMATGVKTRLGLISVGQAAHLGDCRSGLTAPMVTLLELAESSGLGSGVVTTTRITHATPAAAFGHAANRIWESDADLPAEAHAQGCTDLARQLLEFPYGDGIDVMLGGGRNKFLSARQRDPEYPTLRGQRKDGRDLIARWAKAKSQRQYVWNQQQFISANKTPQGQLLGLFEPEHMQFDFERTKDASGEPSLTEMTTAAITRLAQHKNGYVLVIEAGRIDHAHHYGNAYRALTDTLALSDAVRAARSLTSIDDTLIMVTADHSHTLNLVGYPERGNPIMGKVRGASGEEGETGLATDAMGLPYATLVYANGPGYAGESNEQAEGPKRYPHYFSSIEGQENRPDLSNVDTSHPDYLQEAMLPLINESHAGEDVGVWASGPGAAAVHGTIEQNVIFHLLMQAQPQLRKELCRLGQCEADVPVGLPLHENLKSANHAR